jgi:hypothetical protein
VLRTLPKAAQVMRVFGWGYVTAFSDARMPLAHLCGLLGDFVYGFRSSALPTPSKLPMSRFGRAGRASDTEGQEQYGLASEDF